MFGILKENQFVYNSTTQEDIRWNNRKFSKLQC